MKFLILSDVHALSSEIHKLKGYSGTTGSTHFVEDRSARQNRIIAIKELLKDEVGKIDALFILGDLAHQAKQGNCSGGWRFG